MLKFSAAQHDPRTFAKCNLSPLESLALSLRWFASRAALLTASHAYHAVIQTELKALKSSRPLPADAMFVLNHVFHQHVILEARALLDRSKDSFGVAYVATHLAMPEALEGLISMIEQPVSRRGGDDRDRQIAYLSYIERYCRILAVKRDALSDVSHPLSTKAELVRHMGNKAVAHTNLDTYVLDGRDLDDVVIALQVIAVAIGEALGDVACGDDYQATVESGSFRGAGLLLHVDVDAQPFQTNMIRGLLPEWVKSGREFPWYPQDFSPLG
ncbi:MAG: hypothetical protein M3Q42_06700 [Pseudomonadota bacterium]|nr:hypothetical protein [Pseudomonadota bacterium]